MKKPILSSFLILVCLPVFSQVPTAALIAYYPFCGNANDMSGPGHNLTVSGGAYLTSERFSKWSYIFKGLS